VSIESASPRPWPDRIARWEPAPLPVLAASERWPWYVVATTCIGAFLGQLDASIVQLALPTLERSFEARLGTVSWVAIGYQLAFAVALPIFARLADIAGRKILYIAGFALFAIGSAGCALAPDLETLIACRLLLGIAGALAGANSIVILVRSAGPERRATAMGVFAAAQAIGVCLGPVLGGLLLDLFDWRAVFWVGVPIAAVGAVAAFLVVPKSGPAGEGGLDGWGALLLIPALTALLLAITQADRWGLGSAAFLGCMVAVPVLLAGFVWRERRARHPLIKLELVRIPAFAGGMVATASAYAVLYGMFFLMSFALVRGFGASPLEAGLRLVVIPLALALVAPFSGRLSTRFGERRTLVVAMTTAAAAILVLASAIAPGGFDLAVRLVALAVFGGALGLFIAPNNNLTLKAAPEHLTGSAGGLLNLMRMIGCGLGIAFASAVLSWRLGNGGATTVGVDEAVLLSAVAGSLLVPTAFALIAAAAALLHRRDEARAAASAPAPGAQQ
jgi:EmrB/QacA subfamily drug resistance transporter